MRSHFIAPRCLPQQMPTLRFALVITVLSLCSWRTASAQTTPPSSERKTPVTQHQKATAKITVQHSEAHPYDHSVTPGLVELTLTVFFVGVWCGVLFVCVLLVV